MVLQALFAEKCLVEVHIEGLVVVAGMLVFAVVDRLALGIHRQESACELFGLVARS